MKNLSLKWILSCAYLAIFSFSSCSDGEKESPKTNLTPDEHKAELERIGLEALAKINPDDHATLLTAIDEFYRLSDIGYLEIEENAGASAANLLKSVGTICSRTQLGGVSAFANPTNDLYSAARYYGVYTYNSATNHWDKTASNSVLEFRFTSDGQPVIVQIRKSGEEKQIDLFEESGTQYQALVPEHAKATLTRGGEELCNVTVDVNVDGNQRTADVTCTLTANGYVFQSVTHATKTNATEDFTLTVKGEQIVTGKASLNGYDMTDEDNINSVIDENKEVHELFGGATAEINILNEAIIKGYCESVKDMKDRMNLIQDAYPDTSLEYNDKKSEVYNQYIKGELYYTDGDNVIANLGWQSCEDDYYYSSETYYDTEAVIIFASDNSKFSIDSYFDDISFDGLIDSAESLSDQYENYLSHLLN